MQLEEEIDKLRRETTASIHTNLETLCEDLRAAFTNELECLDERQLDQWEKKKRVREDALHRLEEELGLARNGLDDLFAALRRQQLQKQQEQQRQQKQQQEEREREAAAVAAREKEREREAAAVAAREKERRREAAAAAAAREKERDREAAAARDRERQREAAAAAAAARHASPLPRLNGDARRAPAHEDPFLDRGGAEPGHAAAGTGYSVREVSHASPHVAMNSAHQRMTPGDVKEFLQKSQQQPQPHSLQRQEDVAADAAAAAAADMNRPSAINGEKPIDFERVRGPLSPFPPDPPRDDEVGGQRERDRSQPPPAAAHVRGRMNPSDAFAAQEAERERRERERERERDMPYNNGTTGGAPSPRDQRDFYAHNGAPRDMRERVPRGGFGGGRNGGRGSQNQRFAHPDDRQYAASEYGGPHSYDDRTPPRDRRGRAFEGGWRDSDRRRSREFASRAQSVIGVDNFDRDANLSRAGDRRGRMGPRERDMARDRDRYPDDFARGNNGHVHGRSPRYADHGDRSGRWNGDRQHPADDRRPHNLGGGRTADDRPPWAAPNDRRNPSPREPSHFRSDMSVVESIHPHEDYFKELPYPESVAHEHYLPEDPMVPPGRSVRGGASSIAPGAPGAPSMLRESEAASVHRARRPDGRPGEPSIAPEEVSPRSNFDSRVRREKEYKPPPELASAPERERRPPSPRTGSQHSRSRHSRSQRGSMRRGGGRHPSTASSDDSDGERPSASSRRSAHSKSRNRDRDTDRNRRETRGRGDRKWPRGGVDGSESESDGGHERRGVSKDSKRKNDSDTEYESDDSSESRRRRRKRKKRDRERKKTRERERERGHKKDRDRDKKKKKDRDREQDPKKDRERERDRAGRFKKGDFAPDVEPCLKFFDDHSCQMGKFCKKSHDNASRAFLDEARQRNAVAARPGKLQQPNAQQPPMKPQAAPAAAAQNGDKVHGGGAPAAAVFIDEDGVVVSDVESNPEEPEPAESQRPVTNVDRRMMVERERAIKPRRAQTDRINGKKVYSVLCEKFNTSAGCPDLTTCQNIHFCYICNVDGEHGAATCPRNPESPNYNPDWNSKKTKGNTLTNLMSDL